MPRVTFQPGLRSVNVERGERLLVAAWRAGVALKSVCGGRGKCGTCLIEASGANGALSAAHHEERALLPQHASGDDDLRLACMAHVLSDLCVMVPPESEAVRTPPRKPYSVTPVPPAPAVSCVTVEPAAPHAFPLRSLATRLAQALADSGVRNARLPAPVLADFSREAGFDTARSISVTLLDAREAIRLRAGARTDLYGLAVDVGTTSLVAFLCDLRAGSIVAVRTAANPQAAYGEDVISRMTHIQRDAALLGVLQKLVIDDINRLTTELAVEAGIEAADIVDAVIVGNPTMQHLVLGINPEPLGRGPYLPVLGDAASVRAGDIGLAILRQARVTVLPMVAGYIGGDTLAAVLTRDRDFYRGRNLLVDVGTNGEVVLANDGKLSATSCATGPVYEGAHIRCGVRASPGAIERVWVDAAGDIQHSVIRDPLKRGGQLAVGLCGSGVISAVAALVGAGIIGQDGRIRSATHPQVRAATTGQGNEVLLVPARRSMTGRDIVLTQSDVRNVQLGKAALRAGIELLLADSGVQALDRIDLAGTFGNHLDPNDILAIGMVPPLPVERIHSIGNAAGDGARMALFSRHQLRRAQQLARATRVVELTARPEFQDLFVACTALTPGAVEVEAAC